MSGIEIRCYTILTANDYCVNKLKPYIDNLCFCSLHIQEFTSGGLFENSIFFSIFKKSDSKEGVAEIGEKEDRMED